MRANAWSLALGALVLAACALRFVGLEEAPPGFYVDEAAIAAQVICIRDTGFDWWGQRLPLFSKVLGGGFATPTWLYPAAGWTGLFGDGIAAHRSLAALAGVFTVLGVAYLATRLTRDPEAGLLAALACALSPWAFLASRVAWDPSLAPAFVAWGLALALPSLSVVRPWRLGLSGLLLSLAGYAYPPARVTVVIMLAVIGLASWADARRTPGAWRRTLGGGVTLGASFLLLSAPLIALTLSGELQGRFHELAIWSEAGGELSTGSVAQALAANLASYVHPNYWLLSGDPNPRHHFGFGGMLTFFDLLGWAGALLLAARGPMRRPLAILAVGLVAAVLPAALTWEGNPHALRSNTALVFACALAGIGLVELQRRWTWMRWLIPGVALVAGGLYGWVFFARYPDRAARAFDREQVAFVEAYLLEHPNEPAAIERLSYPRLATVYHALRLGTLECPKR